MEIQQLSHQSAGQSGLEFHLVLIVPNRDLKTSSALIFFPSEFLLRFADSLRLDGFGNPLK